MRRFLLIATAAVGLALWTGASTAPAAIHEIVAKFCSGGQGNLDPAGQLNTQGNSFLRALQASKVYDVQFGVNQAGQIGLDVSGPTPVFGPLPAPPAGAQAVSVFVDPTRPNAKLGDFLFWILFVDTEVVGTPSSPLYVYLQIYELEHPAFENCKKFVEE